MCFDTVPNSSSGFITECFIYGIFSGENAKVPSLHFKVFLFKLKKLNCLKVLQHLLSRIP